MSIQVYPIMFMWIIEQRNNETYSICDMTHWK